MCHPVLVSEAVNHAMQELRKATRQRDQALAELHAAIAAAIEAGERQVDLVNQTNYTREHIRRIVAAAKRSR